MIVSRPFKSELVIDEKISDSTLKAYHVGFDQSKFRQKELVDLLVNVIPEFSLGYHCGENIPLTEIVDKLREAASLVYTTDKYGKRGEFGELILHLLLRDFQQTIPLISKIYFKDAANSAVHGFDGVQVSNINNKKKLWLGESKLYDSGKEGIKSLAQDIIKHVRSDYLRSEFNLIGRKIPESIPDIAYWRTLLDSRQKLDVIFANVVIPMVCTYSSELFTLHSQETDDYFKDFKQECYALAADFDKMRIQTSVEILLLLLPVPSKSILNEELDKRLKHIQSI